MHAGYESKTLNQSLGQLVEECGEVLAALGKSHRFGLESSNPELPEDKRETNREWLMREMDDLECAIKDARRFLLNTGPGSTRGVED